MVPVSGPLVTTLKRPADGEKVPVSGPVTNISLFSGDSASTLGSTSSYISLVPSPRAPM